jgi:predicted RNase H-like HicB family nuclease
MTIAKYLRMPWTIERSVHDDDGDYLALHVRELPGFVVAARDEDELERLFWEALPAFLESYLEDGEEPPLPEALLSPSPRVDLGSAGYRLMDPEQTTRLVGSVPTQHHAPTTAFA